MPMNRRRIMATGIGSMPSREPEEALDLIFKYTPCIPFWPQLPKRDLREGMCIQFSQGFSFLKITPHGFIYDPRDAEKQMEDFYNRIINDDIDYFKIDYEFASGLYHFYERLKKSHLESVFFIKAQITGPFTFAAFIRDVEGKLVMQDQILMEAITQGLIRKAVWQIRFFLEFKKKIILFFDEPYLSCFGSAYTPINRETIVKVMNQIFTAVKNLSYQKLNLNPESVLLGVHCCGNTDWSMFTEVLDLDIISFDAFSYGEKLLLYTDNLEGFLRKGGFFCWGIVPTLEFAQNIQETFILNKFNSLINGFLKKGMEREVLFKNFIISPSCGLANIEEKKAERILSFLSEISYKLGEKDNLIDNDK
ncbi:MAG: hypothetical protein NC909_00685 [Candidatus Omnitrophica bacterium]|nr:hypothetical protein [Candidatus Omnitrophota bacterium]